MSTQSKTPLFLMEVVIMLLVFSISASICLKVFAEGKRISEESYQLDKACMETQKAAEYWQSSKGDIAQTGRLLQAKVTGDTLELYFDSDWKPVQKNAVFTLTMETSGAKAEIVIHDQEKELFSLNTEAVIFGE